jgi:hypothetical protein
MLVWQCLSAKNTVNGNPRRVWLGYNSESFRVQAVHVEGYRENPEGMLRDLPTILVQPSEYKRWVKYGEVCGLLTGDY